jgi:ferredoxin
MFLAALTSRSGQRGIGCSVGQARALGLMQTAPLGEGAVPHRPNAAEGAVQHRLLSLIWIRPTPARRSHAYSMPVMTVKTVPATRDKITARPDDRVHAEVWVKVSVDRDACEANAVCAGLVPEVFEVDDEDELHILVAEVPPGLADAVRHAVNSCPKAALRLEE